MTYGHAYQHGFRANLDFKALLNGNPYNPAVHPEAHDAWEDAGIMLAVRVAACMLSE